MDRPNPLDETQDQADRLDEQFITIRGQPHPMILAVARCAESGPGWQDVNISFTAAGISSVFPNTTVKELRLIGGFLMGYADRIEEFPFPCPGSKIPHAMVGFVTDKDGNDEPAQAMACHCGGREFIAYRLISQKHSHIECTECHNCYCIGRRCDPLDDPASAN